LLPRRTLVKVRREKCAIVSGLLLAAAAPARAGDKLTLLCTGWQPVYLRGSQRPQAMALRNFWCGSTAMPATMTTSLRMRRVLANLEASNRYYLATMPLGRLVFNRSLDAVELRSTASTAKAVSLHGRRDRLSRVLRHLP